MTQGGIMALASGGDGGDTDEFISLVREKLWLGDIDADPRRAAGTLPCPVGDPVGERCRGSLCHNRSVGAEVLGGGGVEPPVVGSAGTQKERDEQSAGGGE